MSDPAAREETIFNFARQLSDPEYRAAYLDEACGSDKPLRERVERLLKAELQANEFLGNDPLDLDGNKTPCPGPDLGTVSASMVSVAPAPGDVLEDYEIIERIGGNMGLVFKARHRLLDRIVALKLLPADAITDSARLARFRRELKIMGQLEHTNLVTAVDARIVGRWHMVAMEFIDGTDLERLVETRGALPVADACEAARQTALALQYAHQHGLIHRDIKPSNLMLTHAGTIKVIDMGLAVIQEESTGQLTRTGLVMGTMRYCAPEQFRDASRVDIRADIYSLGCTLFHLLTGKPPYSERTTVAEVVQAHLNEPFPGLAEALPDAPAELNAILARMTAKDPGARFATPGEVAEVLSPFARGANLNYLVSARPSPPMARGMSTPGREPELSPHRPGQRTNPPAGITPALAARRRRMAAALLLLGIIGAVFVATSIREGQRARARVQELERQLAEESQRAEERREEERRRAVERQREQEAARVESQRDPIVVLMDTWAERGVYDKDKAGGNNAQVLSEVLRVPLPHSVWQEPVGFEWSRYAHVLAMRPHLLIMHRSMFFHPLNEKIGLGYPPFTNDAARLKWEALYEEADKKLCFFIGYIGSLEPRTQFLIYSRGTDVRWKEENFRNDWAEKLESRFEPLRGRVNTMLIPNDQNGTFKDEKTAEEMRALVKKILRLPEKRP